MSKEIENEIVKIYKDDYTISLDLREKIICPECGKTDFKFQAYHNKEDIDITFTSGDKKAVVLGLDCCNCKCGFTLNIYLSDSGDQNTINYLNQYDGFTNGQS